MTKPRKRGRKAPTKYLRSRGGIYAEVTGVTKRNALGDRQYRLRYEEGVRGTQVWTLDELDASGVRWIKRKPRGWGGCVSTMPPWAIWIRVFTHDNQGWLATATRWIHRTYVLSIKFTQVNCRNT